MRSEIIALLKTGQVVKTPKSRSGDLDYFISDDDADDGDRLEELIWIEVDVPIHWFGCQFVPSELGFTYNAQNAEQAAREEEREAKLSKWAGSVGGWEKALNISPVLATFGNYYINFLDGWHRSKLAQAAGHTTVRTVVGVRPEVYKNEIS